MKQFFSQEGMAGIEHLDAPERKIKDATVEELVYAIMKKTRASLTVGENGEQVSVSVASNGRPGVSLIGEGAIGLLIYKTRDGAGHAFMQGK